MVVSRGRNNFFENVWREVNRFFRSNISGSQRSVVVPGGANSFTSIRRNYDLEILEIPVRNAEFANRIIELTTYSPDVETAIEIITGDIFSNQDGDDLGFKIDEELDDGSPIDAEVKEILDELFDRVVGGLTLMPAVERMVSYGDAFVSVGIGKVEKGLGIVKLLTLPTWEVFRKEDDQGNLIRFEQRKSLTDSQPAYLFHPAQMIHLRNRRKTLYGRPLFGASCLSAWENLKNATDALARASLEVGYNPTVHTMPPGTDKRFKDAYKQDLESELSQGIVTQYFIEQGAEIGKLSAFAPDLKALIDTVLLWRSVLITRSRLPAWMFSGFTNINGNGAKEISEQPSLAYSRQINSYRMALSEGLKQLCLMELILNDIPVERRKFRIVHPKLFVSTNQLQDPNAVEDGDPAHPDAKAGKTKVKTKASSSSKSKADSSGFLVDCDRDQLIDMFSPQSEEPLAQNV